MAGLLSPLQLQACAGMLQNQGYHVNAELTANISAYTSTPLLANLILAIKANTLPASTQLLLQTFAGNVTTSCPALADSFDSTATYPVKSTSANPGLTGIITITADTYLGIDPNTGNTDLSKFAQNFTQANGYASFINVYIESAANANNYLGPTFTGMDNLVTAGLTEINRATGAMGDDLNNAGQYIDLGNLENYGTPLALIQQISRRAGTTSPLISALTNAGVPENIVLNLNDPAVVVTDSVQKLMYTALTTVTGDELANILRILDVWTPNINTLADLLNPAVMLPNSYPSLTTPTADGLKPIYITPKPEVTVDYNALTPQQSQDLLDKEAAARAVERPLACEIRQSENPVTAQSTAAPATGDTSKNTGSGNLYTPNSALESTVAADKSGTSYERLSVMTNPGLALANKALACSLGQVTNIGRMNLPQLAAAFSAAETNKGLSAIEAQTQPVPANVLDYYKTNMAIGTGVNGTILLTDIIGTPAGTNITQNLSNCVGIINTMYSAGKLNNLITIYNDIYANALASDDSNVVILVSDAQTEISNIKTASPAETANLNAYFSSINAQLTREAVLLTRASIDIGNVQGNNQMAVMGFTSALPSYGRETKVGGTAQYIEAVANTATSVGQATVATLREGRTTEGLAAAGVGTAANKVDSDPTTPPPQAVLGSSRFSEKEARLKINY